MACRWRSPAECGRRPCARAKSSSKLRISARSTRQRATSDRRYAPRGCAARPSAAAQIAGCAAAAAGAADADDDAGVGVGADAPLASSSSDAGTQPATPANRRAKTASPTNWRYDASAAAADIREYESPRRESRWWVPEMSWMFAHAEEKSLRNEQCAYREEEHRTACTQQPPRAEGKKKEVCPVVVGAQQQKTLKKPRKSNWKT